MIVRLRCFVCGLCLLALLSVVGQVVADEVDDYVESQRVEQHIPGLSLLVVDNGKVVKQQGYGLANVEHDVPVNPLIAQGYPSIGCGPCTLRPLLGADPRSGRWAGTASSARTVTGLASGTTRVGT